jgi:hypothetical protein
MMVNQSRRKRGTGEALPFGDGCFYWLSNRHGKCLPLDFLAQPCAFAKRLLIAQRGVANASQLVGQRTGGLVVIPFSNPCSALR